MLSSENKCVLKYETHELFLKQQMLNDPLHYLVMFLDITVKQKNSDYLSRFDPEISTVISRKITRECRGSLTIYCFRMSVMISTVFYIFSSFIL